MRMIRTTDFWIGLILGALLLYLYNTKMKKGGDH